MTANEPVRYQLTKKHICICIPSYTGNLSLGGIVALLESSTAAHKNGWACDLVTRSADSCIQRARSIMFSEFLERSHATDLLFIDADMGWTAEGFVRLLSHDVDIVGGAYRSRGPNEVYILRPLEHELMRDKATGLMEVEGVGTGFLRITRKAAERLAAAYPDDWYTDPTAPGMTIRNMFEFSVEGHKLNSEDYNFCRKARAIGLKVFVDPDQVLDHTGHTTYRGCLMTWLESQHGIKIPDSVPKGQALAHMLGQGQKPSALESAKALLAQGGDA